MLIRGVCYAHTADSGLHGLIWCVQDEQHISTDENNLPMWSFDGLYQLKDGHLLTVFNKDGSICWQGAIDLSFEMENRLNPLTGQIRQTVGGYWVNGLQRGVHPEEWLRFFIEEMRCEFWRE